MENEQHPCESLGEEICLWDKTPVDCPLVEELTGKVKGAVKVCQGVMPQERKGNGELELENHP